MGETHTQREYKSRLFVDLFQSKKELLALYNAVNGSDYDNPDDLVVNTIQDVIYLGMKNDVSFLFDSRMNLFEHQSTWNPNMPLRGLFYFSMLYKGFVAEHGMDIYSSNLLKLPSPHYIVFYNGTREEPDRQVLRLSDSFDKDGREIAVECTAIVLNINLGKNQELMERCQTLYGYSFLVAEIRELEKKGIPILYAIDQAIETCIEKGILVNYLQKHRAEVSDMILTEYNEELHNRTLREEGRAEGEDAISKFYFKLAEQNRMEDLKRAMTDKEFRKKLRAEVNG